MRLPPMWVGMVLVVLFYAALIAFVIVHGVKPR